MKLFSNRFSLIFYSALFNLLFEYSARGLGEFTNRPVFVLILFGIYFTYFMMLEDLIVRFKLTNFQIFIAAFVYGLFPTAFLTGNLFNQNIYWGVVVAGINLGTLFIIGILAWGVMQGIVTLYFANRLVKRDWSHPRMGKVGWSAVILYQIIVMILAHRNPVTPRGTLVGYAVFALIIISGAILFILSLKFSKGQIKQFQPSKVMDFLAFGSIILFLILGTFFVSESKIVTSQPLNQLATTLENYWAFFCGGVFFLYRLVKGEDVSV